MGGPGGRPGHDHPCRVAASSGQDRLPPDHGGRDWDAGLHRRTATWWHPAGRRRPDRGRARGRDPEPRRGLSAVLEGRADQGKRAGDGRGDHSRLARSRQSSGHRKRARRHHQPRRRRHRRSARGQGRTDARRAQRHGAGDRIRERRASSHGHRRARACRLGEVHDREHGHRAHLGSRHAFPTPP